MKIVLGISSGIAAYKTPELAKILVSKGYDVHVVMTSKSAYLVSVEEMENITHNHVSIELFDKSFSRAKILEERKVDHIELAKSTDVIVVAPATANTIANLASGKANDFLTTTILATRAPVLVCPSMNDQMWLHPAVQENIRKIQSYGYIVMTPESGALACGTEGVGRLPAVQSIADSIERLIKERTRLKGKKYVITAGATIEAMDDARILTNRSSGKMGIALAEACYKQGGEVILLKSASSVKTSYPITHYIFKTAEELERLLHEQIVRADVVIHAAAVSDFHVDKIPGKIDSSKETVVTLKPALKIINKLKKWNPAICLIAFKAISGNVKDNIAKINRLLKESNADYIVINDISRADIGFESEENEVTIMDKIRNEKKIGKMSKQEIASKILNSI